MGTRHFAVAPESTWGTPVAPSASVGAFMEIKREAVRLEPEYRKRETIRSKSVRGWDKLFEVGRGPVTVDANYQEIGELLYYLHGDVDTTGAGPYTHTIPGSTGIADRKPFTAEVRRDSDTLTWRYDGMKLTGFNLSVGPDGTEITWNLDGGQSQATGTSATATYRDDNPILPSHWTVSFDDGSTTFCAETITLNVVFPLAIIKCLGDTVQSKEPQDGGTMEITGTIGGALVEDLAEYNNFANDTATDIQLIATDGTHSWTMNMNNCKVRQATPGVDLRNPLKADYEFAAAFDTTATDALQHVLINDHDVITD